MITWIKNIYHKLFGKPKPTAGVKRMGMYLNGQKIAEVTSCEITVSRYHRVTQTNYFHLNDRSIKYKTCMTPKGFKQVVLN